MEGSVGVSCEPVSTMLWYLGREEGNVGVGDIGHADQAACGGLPAVHRDGVPAR